MSSEVISEILKHHIHKLAENGKRDDGRKFDEYRDIKIDVGYVSSAEGSARVKMGSTDVLAGIKMDVGTPFPDTPDRAVMTTNVELIPLASPDFESGPPGPRAVEFARVVDRGVRESKCIDLGNLCISPGEKVWITFIDIHILDYGGNLIDAASLAATAALKNTIVPASKFDLGEDFPMPMADIPVACTFAKINNRIMLDPFLDEENIADARLTVTTDQNGDIRAMQKGLNGSFTLEEVKQMIALSREKGRELRRIVLESLEKGAGQPQTPQATVQI